jgi:hypothetical protein
MLLIAAIALLTVVVAVGGWLASLYLMVERPPARLNWVGLLHGVGGVVGFAVMVAALQVPAGAHAVRMGVGRFGWFAAFLVGAALLAGLVILATHMRRLAVPNSLVATHGLLAVSGYTLLVTYLTMLR